MIKFLFYEWVLLCANILGCQKREGFFDTKKLYKKKGWLRWEIIELKTLKEGEGKK